MNPIREISIDEQIRKFSIKSLRGFNTVLVFGIGRRLGIFDFLEKKGEDLKKIEKISSITFKFDELVDHLKFNYKYLEAWLHMAIECGIFEMENSFEKSFKTAPFVYDILVNRNSGFYTGHLLGCFYYTALFFTVAAGSIPYPKYMPLNLIPASLLFKTIYEVSGF